MNSGMELITLEDRFGMADDSGSTSSPVYGAIALFGIFALGILVINLTK